MLITNIEVGCSVNDVIDFLVPAINYAWAGRRYRKFVVDPKPRHTSMTAFRKSSGANGRLTQGLASRQSPVAAFKHHQATYSVSRPESEAMMSGIRWCNVDRPQ